MEKLVVELAVGAVYLVIGWVFVRLNKLEQDIDTCVKKDDFDEVKSDLKTTIELLTEARVENARWQERISRVLEKDSKKY